MKKYREANFSGMISENKSAQANMPQDVVMKDYPKCSYMEYDLDDTIRGIDDQIDNSVSTARKHKSKSMY